MSAAIYLHKLQQLIEQLETREYNGTITDLERRELHIAYTELERLEEGEQSMFKVYVKEESIMEYVVHDCDSEEQALDLVRSGEIDGKCLSCSVVSLEVIKGE